MKFNTAYNRPKTIESPMGNGERSIFEERVVDGEKRLVITGKESVKDFIEASKQETLISNIMKRFEQGDINALSRVQGFYGDVTGMPSNLAEAQNILIRLENDFAALPVDVKVKFDNSFDKYVKSVSEMSQDEFLKTFDLLPKNSTVDVPKSESEVVVNE